MNERIWWRTTVQPKLHAPTMRCLALKQEDQYIKGRPDVAFCIPDIVGHGYIAGQLELKYDKSWPARATTKVDAGLEILQLRQLAMWRRATGDWRTALVLFGVSNMFYLYPHDSDVLAPTTKHTQAEYEAAAIYCGTSSMLHTLWSWLANQAPATPPTPIGK